jgi:hypothetical protein
MKRAVITAFVAFLALPALAFAGSVTSRWDMNIGGFVKFDFGYADNGVGADYSTAPRGSYMQNQTLNDQYGNWYSAAGETRLNFLIKGPDGGGAKTSAFIEGEFRGQGASGTGPGASYGTFTLRHAFMKLDWPNATLTAGQTWNRWGYIPSFSAVGALYSYNGLRPFNKGVRQPRLDYEQRFGPGFAAALAVIANTNTFATANGQIVNNNTRSDYPWVEGEFRYNTDKCGKIGPYGLLAALGGFIGQSKIAYQAGFNADGVPIRFTDQTVRAWGVALKGFIPIIPEKNKNKKGALAIGGNLFYGQNMTDWFQNGTAPYIGAGSALPAAGAWFNSPRYEAPTSFGGWGQVSYWFTDKFFADGYFGYTRSNLSDPYMWANPNTPESTTHLIFNVNYDLNQAVRFGLEYAWVKTQYSGKQLTGVDALGNRYYLDSKGSFNTLRIGAYYFF